MHDKHNRVDLAVVNIVISFEIGVSADHLVCFIFVVNSFVMKVVARNELALCLHHLISEIFTVLGAV